PARVTGLFVRRRDRGRYSILLVVVVLTSVPPVSVHALGVVNIQQHVVSVKQLLLAGHLAGWPAGSHRPHALRCLPARPSATGHGRQRRCAISGRTASPDDRRGGGGGRPPRPPPHPPPPPPPRLPPP